MFVKKMAAAVLAALALVGMAMPAASADEFGFVSRTAGDRLVGLDEIGQMGVDQGPVYFVSRQLVGGREQCLDLMETVGDGKQIGVYDCHWGNNQKWYYNQDTSTFHIEIKTHNYRTECADVYNSTGPTISRYPCRLQKNQLWEAYQTDSPDHFEFRSYLDPSTSRNRCLDMAGDGTRRALLFECRGTFNQHWKLKRA